MNQKTAKNLLEKIIADYNDISEDFDKTRKNEWKEFEQFLEFIQRNQTIADLGCGNGRFYKFLKKSKLNIDYVGVDNNTSLLEKAQKSFPNVKFVKGDLLTLPIQDNHIDTAIAIASLHHIPSTKLREKAISEMFRILKKDGILIITVWNLFQSKYKKYIWKSRLRHILSFGKYDWHDTFIPWGHSGVKRYYYAFKQKELRKLLKKNFEIIRESTEKK